VFGVARPISLIDGRKVRAELDRLGLTQSAFAKQLGVREATVTNVLNGGHCSIEMLVRIAVAIRHPELAR
jgi:plasmid maintenance system antidote protein VapI